MMLQEDKPDDFVIATGVQYSVRQSIEWSAAELGITLWFEGEGMNEGYTLAKIIAMRLCDHIRAEDAETQYKTLIPCNQYGSYDKFDPKNSHLLPAIIFYRPQDVEL